MKKHKTDNPQGQKAGIEQPAQPKKLKQPGVAIQSELKAGFPGGR